MSLSVSSSNSSLLVLPLPTTDFKAVLSFAEKIRPLPPPSGMLARRVSWIESCSQQLVQSAYRLYLSYGKDQVKALKEQMAGAEPSEIARLAKPYAKILPEFAFLTIWYGEKNKETAALKTYWLSRGYLLFSDNTTGVIELSSEDRLLLENYADIICFEAEILQLPLSERVSKAVDFLEVASSSLNKDNLPFVANVITETFYALFPDGVGPKETELWSLLNDVISDAKEIDGVAQGTYFDDQLLIFVKLFLRKTESDENEALHAIRHHLRNANTPQSNSLLRYLADKKWKAFDSINELAIIRKEISLSEKLVPETLIGQIFKQFLDNPIFEPQAQAELYLFPSPWRDHLSAVSLRYYLGPLALPSGQENLFTAIFLSDKELTRYVSHLFLTEDKAVITPPLITPKDGNAFVSFRIFRLFEESMEYLRKHQFNQIGKLVETISWRNIQEWFHDTAKDAVSLKIITDIYQSKFLCLKELNLPSDRVKKLKEETEITRLELINWMKACWKQLHTEDTQNFPFEKYTEEELVIYVPAILKVMEPKKISLLTESFDFLEEVKCPLPTSAKS